MTGAGISKPAPIDNESADQLSGERYESPYLNRRLTAALIENTHLPADAVRRDR